MKKNTLALDFPLASSKVSLRTFVEKDITSAYLAWLNDIDVMRFSNQRFKRHTRTTCLAYLHSFDNAPNQFLSIHQANNETAIGTMTLYYFPQHGTVDLGILIGDKTKWGKGYGLDAWRLLINRLLMQEPIRKVSAGTLACNLPMISVLEKSGMCLEGRRTAHEIVDHQAIDVLYYGRFREA